MSRPSNEIRKCIYCLIEQIYSNESSISHFNSEHVVHAGLTAGIDRTPNLTLIGLVCSNCNKYFGRKLDQQFLRSGYIGMLRFDAGQKVANKFYEFDRTSLTLTAHRTDEPVVHGTPVARVVRNGKLCTEFEPVAALELDGAWHYLTEEQIDRGDVPKIATPTTFRMMCDADEEPLILEKLSRIYKLLESNEQWTIGYTPVLGQGQLREVELRSLCKIAFNYLAYVCSDLLRDTSILFYKNFHELRNFVRYGSVPSFTPVLLDEEDVVPSVVTQVPERYKHIVSISQEKNGDRSSIICRVNLFNCITWSIMLSQDCRLTQDKLHYGHIWDLKENTCLLASQESLIPKSLKTSCLELGGG